MKTPLLLFNLLGSSSLAWRLSDEDVDFGTPWWWIYAGISAALVLFAGIMSGLTLGLMSLGLMDLEVLQQSGTEEEKKQAAAILPVVKEQHQLLVTLLLCNAAAMEVSLFHLISSCICSAEDYVSLWCHLFFSRREHPQLLCRFMAFSFDQFMHLLSR
jgi:hypothetical protein